MFPLLTEEQKEERRKKAVQEQKWGVRAELEIYSKLQELSDEYTVWYEKDLGYEDNKREIDFIIFHRLYGLWVIETKDWNLSTIREWDDSECKIETPNGERSLMIDRKTVVYQQ